jgi:hypothetical protein
VRYTNAILALRYAQRNAHATATHCRQAGTAEAAATQEALEKEYAAAARVLQAAGETKAGATAANEVEAEGLLDNVETALHRIETGIGESNRTIRETLKMIEERTRH